MYYRKFSPELLGTLLTDPPNLRRILRTIASNPLFLGELDDQY